MLDGMVHVSYSSGMGHPVPSSGPLSVKDSVGGFLTTFRGHEGTNAFVMAEAPDERANVNDLSGECIPGYDE